MRQAELRLWDGLERDRIKTDVRQAQPRTCGKWRRGTDETQNGIALSATADWLFDRYLISLDDDFGLLASDNKVSAELRQLFPSSGRPIRLPRDARLHPRPEYGARHRERFAGGARCARRRIEDSGLRCRRRGAGGLLR